MPSRRGDADSFGASANSAFTCPCDNERVETAEQTVAPARRLELGELRVVAIVPAFNEEHTIPRIIDELRAVDSRIDIVVVDDGSVDLTADVAAAKGAKVLRLPFNLGIGGAVQTGFRFAFERGYDLAVRVDGDGQHEPAQLPRILEPVLRDEVDIAVGSRFAGGTDGYRSSRSRRLGIQILAWVVSRIVGQTVTDTTSGFQAVSMRERGGGRSSITALRSIYYMVKVLLAIFVGLFRRDVVPQEEAE